jgi:hypothetical protein
MADRAAAVAEWLHANHDLFLGGFDWIWSLTAAELQRSLNILGQVLDLDCDGRLSAELAAEQDRGK